MKRLLFIVLIMFDSVGIAATSPHSGRTINLELEAAPGATSYEIELTSKNTKKVQIFKMKKPYWNATIKPGEFFLRLRSYDSRSVPGEWSPPMPFSVKLPAPDLSYPEQNAEIDTMEIENYKTEFKWASVPGSQSYRVEITGDDKIFTGTFNENTGFVDLPVAKKYTWKVTPISATGVEGDAQEQPQSFSLIGKSLETPEIEKQDIYVQTLRWNQPIFTETFEYILSQRTDNQWKKIDEKKSVKENEIPFPLEYPGGEYRLTVKASAPLRKDSKIAKLDFKVYSGSRTPAAIEEAKLRHSLEKPDPWYFVASYLITEVQYRGTNQEATREVAYNALGGTGRLGIAHVNPKTNLGFLGIVDLSGFTLDGKNVTYPAAELHALWRLTWGRNMIRPSVGFFYKELVESHNTALNPTVYEQLKIAYAGPHVGFDFWRPMTSTLGFQISARLYYGLLGLKTPNDGEFVSNFSYQMSLMGSYKLSPHMTGFLGWASRQDVAVYKSRPFAPPISFAPEGANQEISINGNYLSLALEWGF